MSKKKTKGDVSTYRKMNFKLTVEVLLGDSEIQFYFHDTPTALFELIPLKAIATMTRPPWDWIKDIEFTFKRKTIVFRFYPEDTKP